MRHSSSCSKASKQQDDSSMNWFRSVRPPRHQTVVSNSSGGYQRPFRPPQYSYFAGPRRKVTKRRGVSPKIFPRKILVTEDKVAADLCKLRISAKKRYRTLAEIEASLETDSEDDESDDEGGGHIVISDELKKQIDDFKRNLFLAKPTEPTNKLQSILNEPSTSSAALVLWKPPSGVVENVMQKISSSSKDLPSTPAGGDVQMTNGGVDIPQCKGTGNSYGGCSTHQPNIVPSINTVFTFSAPNYSSFTNVDDDDAMEL